MISWLTRTRLGTEIEKASSVEDLKLILEEMLEYFEPDEEED